MHTPAKLSITLIAVAGMMAVPAGAVSEEPGWLAPSIGPISPQLHFNGAIGDSSGDPEELATGHHDPTREDGTVQGIEAGASLRLGMLEGFATYNLHYGAEEEWEDEWEEAFLKLKDIPGGFEIRGGRMLARYGRHNAQHLHAWEFVDMPLVWGLFLGDDGLILDGGDLTWLKRGISTTYGITIAYGEPKTHDHEHGEHEDEEDEEGEEEHEDHEEHAHHDAITFDDDVAAGRLFAQHRRDDFNAFETGASVAIGDDEAGRQIAVYGVDFSYTWREKGMEAGGRALTWLTEVLFRDVDDGEVDAEHEEHDDEEHEYEDDDHEHEMLPGGTEFGLYSQLIFTVNRMLDVGARVGYVGGSDDLESEERLRLSPAVTVYLDPYRRTSLRAQYNYDDLMDHGEEEHTAWLQLGVNWGGAEVR